MGLEMEWNLVRLLRFFVVSAEVERQSKTRTFTQSSMRARRARRRREPYFSSISTIWPLVVPALVREWVIFASTQ
jgi:hypothetical protein